MVPLQNPIRPRKLSVNAVYMIINNLMHGGMERDATYTWLADNTVAPNGQKYTRDTVETRLVDSGSNSMVAPYIDIDTDTVMKIIKTVIEGKEFPYPTEYINAINVYRHGLYLIVKDLLHVFLFQPNPNFIYLTEKQFSKKLPAETIYAIINNLMYNREAAYEWLIASTVDKDGNPYTRDIIDTVLIQYGFNNIVAQQQPISQDAENQ